MSTEPIVWGPMSPLRRVADDFDAGEGIDVISSNVRQVIRVQGYQPGGAILGEYPWRLPFGSGVNRIRHANYDGFTGDLIRINVTDAVSLWEPRAITSAAGMTFSAGSLGGHLLLVHVASSVKPGATRQIEVTL